MIRRDLKEVEGWPKLLEVAGTLWPLFLGSLFGLAPLFTTQLAINVPCNPADLIINLSQSFLFDFLFFILSLIVHITVGFAAVVHREDVAKLAEVEQLDVEKDRESEDCPAEAVRQQREEPIIRLDNRIE